MADEITPQQANQEEELQQETDDGQVTRRQFLIGAGVGAVVGAAGVGGVLTLVKPTDSTATKTAPTQQAPQTASASNLPPTMRQVTLNIDGKAYEITTDVRASLW